MCVVRAENSDYSKNDGKNTEKEDKFKQNSYTSRPRVGLDGDVDGVDRRLLQPRRKPPKMGQKFATLQIYKSSKRLRPHPPDRLPHIVSWLSIKLH